MFIKNVRLNSQATSCNSFSPRFGNNDEELKKARSAVNMLTDAPKTQKVMTKADISAMRAFSEAPEIVSEEFAKIAHRWLL